MFGMTAAGTIGVLSALASAAGAGTSMAAQAAARDKANQDVNRELQRQKGFQQHGKETFVTSLGKSGSDVAKQQIDTGAQQHLAEYQKAQALPSAISQPGQLEAPSQNVHQQAENTYVNQQGQARAQLGGLTDWQTQQWIKNLRAQQQLAQNSNFAHGSQNVLPFELEQAAHSQDTMAGIGTGLSALGALGGGIGGLMGSGLSAAGSLAGAGTQASGYPQTQTFQNLWNTRTPQYPTYNYPYQVDGNVIPG